MPLLLLPKNRGGAALAWEFLRRIFPLVDAELKGWQGQAALSPDGELKNQALQSLRHKRFHALGGSFYALYGGEERGLVRFITAYQTISDYLDNLCDRAGVLDGESFRRLHRAMLDALTPGEPCRDYYRYYPRRDDGGYLKALVGCCRDFLKALPAYPRVQEEALELASLYCDLQVYKHLEPEQRVPRLAAWHAKKCPHPGLSWWEFGAASGSTLGVFALVAAVAGGAAESGGALMSGYFPHICGLHILLDYYIDQAEDQREGDLNFVSQYGGGKERRERLLFFTDKALAAADRLPSPAFHRLAVQGLLALYLSDPKVEEQGLGEEAGLLLKRGGLQARALHSVSRGLRRRRLL